MGLSLSQKLGPTMNTPRRMFFAFANTDEIFAAASSQPEKLHHRYLYGLMLMPIIGWSLGTFLGAVKEKLGCQGLRYVSGGRKVCRVAVGGGSCADGMLDALAAGCDTFVTADVKYNQFWDARDLGLNLIDAGHFYTENPVTAVLAEKIAAAFPDVEVKISQNHGDCMKFY